MLDNEALELLKHGFSRCFYVSLYCPHCGSIRLMTAFPPDGEWCGCPVCNREHCNCGQIGFGYTRRTLPQHDILMEPINVSRMSGLEDISPLKPQRKLLTRGQRLATIGVLPSDGAAAQRGGHR